MMTYNKKTDSQNIAEFLSKPIFDVNKNYIPNNDFPKITIITPSFNQGVFLERAILSVLNQCYPNLEYIILDGGSNDQSVSIIKKYENYLSFWESKKDGGQISAINKGLKMATGELIAFQNSDDCYIEGAFKTLYCAKMMKDADVFFGHLLTIDSTDMIINYIRCIDYSVGSQIFEGMQGYNQSTFFKRHLFEKYGYMNTDLHYSFDYEFVIRLSAQKELKHHLVKNLWGALRCHEDTKTSHFANTVGKQDKVSIRKIYAKQIRYHQFVSPTILNYYYKCKKIVHLICQQEFNYLIYKMK